MHACYLPEPYRRAYINRLTAVTLPQLSGPRSMAEAAQVIARKDQNMQQAFKTMNDMALQRGKLESQLDAALVRASAAEAAIDGAIKLLDTAGYHGPLKMMIADVINRARVTSPRECRPSTPPPDELRQARDQLDRAGLSEKTVADVVAEYVTFTSQEPYHWFRKASREESHAKQLHNTIVRLRQQGADITAALSEPQTGTDGEQVRAVPEGDMPQDSAETVQGVAL